MFKKINKNKKAFTLIELLVVVIIIGILAAIALPQYIKVLKKARYQDAIFNLLAIKRAQESYYLLNGTYTKNINALDVDLNIIKFTYSCIREDVVDCYAQNIDGSLPLFEITSGFLYCRGSREQCLPVATTPRTIMGEGYWIIEKF